jgi:DNA-directed RNA polymerase specialized sigma24 family protein
MARILELETYLQNAEERRFKVQVLREKDLSYREIATEMGISVASVSGYLKAS